MKGKRKKRDVQEFSLRLMDNILSLHSDLKEKEYVHGPYEAFKINDPKPRDIHKAAVRDRLVHHAVYRQLYPFFDRTFIADSYSCRLGKGTHRAIRRFAFFSQKVSKNNTKTCWVLKCDIRKFFSSINHGILLGILAERIPNPDILWLLHRVISSFHSTRDGFGLPLGNLTSQLFVNIYMNEFDQFVKHKLKVRYYLRYADDFSIISHDRAWLVSIAPRIRSFLSDRLMLALHPDKISIKTLASGVDYLGWVHFPDHRVLRTKTKRRMFRGSKEAHSKHETVQSYLGLLSHGNAYHLRDKISRQFTH